MKFGFHISIAGGFSKVVKRAKILKCETIQIFSGNPRSWQKKELNLSEIKRFKRDLKKENISPLFVHLPYLLNLATREKKLYLKSVNSLKSELRRTRMLGSLFLVAHLGSNKSITEDKDKDLGEALNNISCGINLALKAVRNGVILLLENASGQGNEVGYNFKQIKMIMSGIEDKERVGVCLDTAHLFQAGYDLSNKEGLERTLEEFDRIIGFKKLYLIHLNDSKTKLSSRIDRHEDIGCGYIGLKGFKNIIHHPQLLSLPAIMETPRKTNQDDLRNMETVKRIRGF